MLKEQEIYNATVDIINKRKETKKGPFQAMVKDYIQHLGYFPRAELWELVKNQNIKCGQTLNSWYFLPLLSPEQ
ncbi:hypothetical protein K5X82_07385 [Halosquirtibacter xylanolyticus]|uniref:hypothetical protein n=1 Tax=Halosquirtibacter xylanolyticus TaxID=3374599 RepID=UPI003749631C|nr:hypothetical protein K5X82_07385 [Prolixibacteraceae bacterium]